MVNKSMLYNFKPSLIKYHLDRFKAINASDPDIYALVVRFASSPCFMVFPKSYLKQKKDNSIHVVATSVGDKVVSCL